MLYHYGCTMVQFQQSDITLRTFSAHFKQLCMCISAAEPAINLTMINLQCIQPRPGLLCRLLQLCSLLLDACGHKKLLSKSSFLTGALGDSCISILMSANFSWQEQRDMC